MKVTIGKVAREAGVSISTVSRVLNTPQLVTPDTRRRVSDVIERLGFEPNNYARNLGGQHTTTIGMVVPGIKNLYFNELYSGIDKAATERQVHVLLYNVPQWNFNEVMKGFSVLKQRQCDGIIYTSGSVEVDAAQIIGRLGVPVVLTLTGDDEVGFPAFKVDEVTASFDAVAHLVTRGHRRIAMIAGNLKDKDTGQLRYSGFRSALKHYQLDFREECLAFGSYHFEDGYEAMGTLLEHRKKTEFTAVFAASDEMALGALRRICEAGLSVPDDVSIVGFDNLSVSRMVTPQLTTVAQPFEKVGEEAVHYLVDLITSGRKPEPGVRYLRHQLITRESVKALYP